jgi:perosamine synthetase
MGKAVLGLREANPDVLLAYNRMGRAPDEGLACLSLRSGFDLYLQALALPAGSEVLVTAFTIPDMVRILEHHGLVPVPIDLDLDTLAPTRASLESALTPLTQAILYAHRFGSRDAAGPALEVAAQYGLRFWEDLAQAYVGDDYRAAPEADLAMFSFGTIKTATALGGGMLTVRDALLRDELVYLSADPDMAEAEVKRLAGLLGRQKPPTPPQPQPQLPSPVATSPRQ